MRLTIFRVPEHHFTESKHQIAFRHAWQGRDMYWIVPMHYVVKYDFKRGMWQIQLSEDYFTRPVNVAA